MDKFSVYNWRKNFLLTENISDNIGSIQYTYVGRSSRIYSVEVLDKTGKSLDKFRGGNAEEQLIAKYGSLESLTNKGIKFEENEIDVS
jgi:hypothetical protein